MSIFESIGFVVVVFGTGMAIAAMMVLAGFGAVTLWHTLLRGAELRESDEKIGREYHQTIKG